MSGVKGVSRGVFLLGEGSREVGMLGLWEDPPPRSRLRPTTAKSLARPTALGRLSPGSLRLLLLGRVSGAGNQRASDSTRTATEAACLSPACAGVSRPPGNLCAFARFTRGPPGRANPGGFGARPGRAEGQRCHGLLSSVHTPLRGKIKTPLGPITVSMARDRKPHQLKSTQCSVGVLKIH